MRFTIRPLDGWREKVTDPRRSSSMFRATWRDTLTLLGDELDLLDAANVVIQVDVMEGDIRLDGMLRADAKVGFPGVRISFDSRHGPLTYATDAYERQWSASLPSWQANVRAIALGLGALRAIDRWGITRRGEQYVGWKALPAGSGAIASHMTRDQALTVLRKYAPAHKAGEPVDRLVRWAKAGAHPDRHGGDRTAWDQVELAERVLERGP